MENTTSEEVGCFIATVVFSIKSYEVGILCKYRDRVIMTNVFGRFFIWLFYKISPRMVRVFEQSQYLIKLKKNPCSSCK